MGRKSKAAGVTGIPGILNKKLESIVAKREEADKKFLEEQGPKVLSQAEVDFKAIVETDIGCAVIIAGSGSDYEAGSGELSHVDKIVQSLRKYHIPFEARVCSAHKQPEKALELIKNYNSYQGSLAIISVAGGTDALSGVLSYHSTHPVISCPPDGLNSSSLVNPEGSANAFVRRPGNLGKYVAQMFSTKNPEAKKALEEETVRKVVELQESDSKYRLIYYGRQEFFEEQKKTINDKK